MRCKTKKSYWQQDIRKREYLQAVLQGLGLIGLISYLFYGTWWCALLLIPYLFRYLQSWKKQTMEKKKQEFRLQFKEAILSLSAALNVGYSVENALREARKELKLLYSKDAPILRELQYMLHQLDMNVPIETAFQEFAARTKEEEVELFVTVFSLAKRSGGDLIGMIRNTVQQIGEKIDVKREIDTMMTAKKLEFRIMSAIPFAMICYLKFSFPDFMDVLYGNVTGVCVMTVCLLIYGASYTFGKRIVEIEV
ncbi:MAG: type II secretion system F family protein [Faecalimonas sp.]|nr:type II secretion system F family protein [Faecalimonas sp.]